jgi:hypothetical protein
MNINTHAHAHTRTRTQKNLELESHAVSWCALARLWADPLEGLDGGYRKLNHRRAAPRRVLRKDFQAMQWGNLAIHSDPYR